MHMELALKSSAFYKLLYIFQKYQRCNSTVVESESKKKMKKIRVFTSESGAWVEKVKELESKSGFVVGSRTILGTANKSWSS